MNMATKVMDNPTSRLLSALQTNSSSLMRLTSEFKFELPRYQVLSFYELKPMGDLSSLVSRSTSCLVFCFEVERVHANKSRLLKNTLPSLKSTEKIRYR